MENTNVNVPAKDSGAVQPNAVAEFTARADAEFARLIREGKYEEILAAMENLGKYSLRNIMLILSQNPEAANVAGMREWNYHGRSISQGQKGIKILAPRMNDGKLVENENGQVDYKLNTVFHVSQTHGKDLKQTRCTIEFIEENYEGLKAAVAKLADGYTFTENGKRNTVDYAKKEITLKEGLSREDILKGMIYSAAAVATEGRDREAGKDISQGRQMFNEIEETAVAHIVSRRMGLGDFKLKTVDFTQFDDAAVEKLSNNLSRIRSMSQKFINHIEQYVSDIENASVAGAASEANAQEPEPAADEDSLRSEMMNSKAKGKKSKQAEKGGMEL